jgi:HWE histidine kinase
MNLPIRHGERVDHYDTVRVRKDGTSVDISLTVSPIRDAAGKIIGASKIARDITDRKRAPDRQQLLTREIQHRTKNLFAVVQAVVARSLADKETLQDTRPELTYGSSGLVYVLAGQLEAVIGEPPPKTGQIRRADCRQAAEAAGQCWAGRAVVAPRLLASRDTRIRRRVPRRAMLDCPPQVR